MALCVTSTYAESALEKWQTAEKSLVLRRLLGNNLFMNDHIGDLINRIKTAGNAGKATVSVAYSLMSESILSILKKKGFDKGFKVEGKEAAEKKLVVELAYFEDKTPRVTDFVRVSKQSRRMYTPARTIPSVRGGVGLVVMSTPKGVLAGEDARKEHVGGEVLFKIW